MKRLHLFAILLLAASSLFAQTPPPEKTEVQPPAPAFVPNLFGSFFTAGLQTRTEDRGGSSKFEEYRDVPSGLTGPSFRVFSDANGNPFLVSGENIAQEDRRFYVWADTPVVRVDILYDQIPHRLGNRAKSPEKIVARDALGISDYIQASLQNALTQRFNTNRTAINFAFLKPLVEPLVNTPEVFNLGFVRKRAFLTVGLFPDAPVDTTISYFQENRSGTRSAGTSFGFGNTIETPEPVDYRTREAGVRLEMPLENLMIRGMLSINQFSNTYSTYTWDNPFRVTDSTDPSAYTAPGSGSIGGASRGRLALPPENSRITAAIGGIYKMPMHSRLTADIAFGQMRSNGDLMPFTTNTAILATVPEANELPVERFNGRINTTSATVVFTTRPLANFNVTARYRFYNSDNNARRIEFPGYVRFDAVWEEIPRITVPYSTKNNRAEITASYDLGTGYSVEAGFRNDRTNRTFREVNRTTENIAHIALDARPFTWVTWRNSFEFGDRSFDSYDQERADNASFVEPEPPVSPEGFHRFDVAERSTQRVISILSINPFNGPLSATLNFTRYFDNYSKHSELGLLKWRNQTFTAEADYSPSGRWSTFAFYSREYWAGFQRGRQSGATPSKNPLDNWTADNSDKANSVGAGFTMGVIPEKLDFNLTGRIQRVSGYANLDSPPGGTPDVAFDIPNVDDTRFWSLLAQFNYKLSAAWNLALGGWYERYQIDDLLNTGTQQYLPGGFFLAPNDLGYRGSAAYVTSTYRW